MKIFIITEGSKDIGLGHITRCTSLYQAFQEKGAEPEFIANSDEFAEKLLIGKKYQLFDWLKDSKKLFDIITGAELIVLDSYLADAEFYHRVSQSVDTAIYIDDNRRIEYPAGIVLNGTIGAEELDYLKNADIDYLLGSRYMPLRKNFGDVPKKDIKEKIGNIMVIIGGSDYRNIVPVILKRLKERFFNMNKNVIIGTGFTNVESVRREADENTYLIYYPEAERIRDMMAGSDIAISAGGQTLYELARMGVPTIAIPVVDNQMGNIKAAKRSNLIEYAGWWEEPEVLDRLVECIDDLRDKGKREGISAKAQEFVDGQGALRVAEFVLQKARERIDAAK